ncbi:MAG: septum formation initiator family protein [Paracoccaceae bacterium]
MMDRVSWTQFLVPGGYIFLVGVIAIFAHSGLQGDHGLAAYHDANQEAARIAAELEALQAERVAMANQVNRLSEKFLDLDLLDERARDVLGLVRPDEIVAR